MTTLTAAQTLGAFAAKLNFSDIPSAVVERAKDCIIDTVAAARFGAQFPWSRMAVDYARRYGSGGPCSIFGNPDVRVHAPYAALANGVLVHAFELDNGRYPPVGAHGGAVLLPAVIAACQEMNADGKTAVTAFIIGCEVMFRIAAATHHSAEKLGFHAPALSGPYGACVAAGRVFGLSAEQLAYGLGIAGSLSSGLLAFTKSKEGGMVKRLHLGRASESGILASRLASAGYTGPETILEGKFGFLEVYTRDPEPELMTAGLHKDWETLKIIMKRYPIQFYAHTPVQSLRELMAENGFKGSDVTKIIVEGTERLASHHNITEPGDIMQAQYSIPFSLALALFRDPEDPNSLVDNALNDPTIRAACRSLVEIRTIDLGKRPSQSTRTTVKLKDGREFSREADTYKGMPANPFSRADIRRKFMFTAGKDEAGATRVLEQLENLEAQPRFPM